MQLWKDKRQHIICRRLGKKSVSKSQRGKVDGRYRSKLHGLRKAFRKVASLNTSTVIP
jgi:hypothetical protein